MTQINEQQKVENQLSFQLYAASRVLMGRYTPLLKKLELTYTQYIVMAALWDEDNVPVGELCRKLYLDNGTITPVLKKLESNGYISRTRSRADERVTMISLKAKGERLKERAKDIPSQINSTIKLNSGEARALHNLLDRILEE